MDSTKKVRHIVLLEFKELAQTRLVMEKLEEVARAVHGFIAFSHGRSVSIEGLNRDKNYGFTIDFQSTDALKAYLDHPEHIKLAKEHILPAQKNGIDSVLAFDYFL